MVEGRAHLRNEGPLDLESQVEDTFLERWQVPTAVPRPPFTTLGVDPHFEVLPDPALAHHGHSGPGVLRVDEEGALRCTVRPMGPTKTRSLGAICTQCLGRAPGGLSRPGLSGG